MNINQQLIFFFSALGTFNGIILSLYFMLHKKQKKVPSRFFLGLFLLMLSIRLGKSVELYFNPHLAKTFIQIGLSACFLIGPSFLFYILSCFPHQKDVTRHWKNTFAVLLGIVAVGGIFFSYPQNPDLWKDYIIKIIYAEWFFFILLSACVYWILSRDLQKGKKPDSLLKPVFICNLIVSAAYFYSYWVKTKTSYIAGSILFSLFLYLNFFMFFSEKSKTNGAKEQDKYSNKKIPGENASGLLSKLEKMVLEEELYKNPNLKLSDVASLMNISSHQLSQLLNDNLGKSFSTYINEFRIDEACKRIVSASNLKIEEIGYDVGFNSKSTFFTTFKKIKNTTPQLYRKAIRE